MFETGRLIQGWIRRSRTGVLILLGGMALALWSLGPPLNLPYLFDDPVVLESAQEASWSEIWTSFRWPVGYYRPLALSLWKAAIQVSGEHAVRMLRGLALALHLMNALLVGALYLSASRQSRIPTRSSIRWWPS